MNVQVNIFLSVGQTCSDELRTLLKKIHLHLF